MRAHPARLLLLLPWCSPGLLSACDADAPTAPTTTSACEIDRDCQDGDLCNGPEACVAGHCVSGEPAALARCEDPEPACGGVCAEDEACSAGRCEAVCLPPLAPHLPVVPVGTRVAFPEGALVWVDEPASSVRPARPSDLDSHHGLTLDRPGPVTVEARWAEADRGCEQATFRATYEVVTAPVTTPELAPDAIAMDDPRLVQWAAGWAEPTWGTELAPEWMDLTRALGPATGAWDDATSLGNGGAITLIFETPVADHPGPELAVFENGFSESFLELAHVEVSSDGLTFARFPSLSTQTAPVAAYGTLDPGAVLGLAGRFRGGFGAAFDLATLAQTPEVLTGRVDLGAITHVRVVDVVGDGSDHDSLGHPIYDPTPTYNSAGFDLEAIGALAP